MTETDAKEEIREIAAELKGIGLRLLGVQASLPASPAERFRLLEEEEAMDTSAEIRAVVGCVLQDRIQPAIEDLLEVAASVEVEVAARV
jgi:hypothetical protein